jgi:hypothetical protein
MAILLWDVMIIASTFNHPIEILENYMWDLIITAFATHNAVGHP